MKQSMESQAAQLSPLFVFGQLMLESALASERGSWRQAFSAIFRSSGLGALPAWPPSTEAQEKHLQVLEAGTG